MGIGVSLLLIAAGAILLWGVTGEVAGIDIDAIGVILIVVGVIGGVLSMIFWSSWGGFHRRTATYVDDGYAPVAPRRRSRTIVEDDVPPAGPPPP